MLRIGSCPWLLAQHSKVFKGEMKSDDGVVTWYGVV